MRCVPDLSCLGADGTAFIKSPALNKNERSLLWYLAHYCDWRAEISDAPAEQQAWRDHEGRCLAEIGLRRVGKQGRPSKVLKRAFARQLRIRYNEVRRQLLQRKSTGSLDLKAVQSVLEWACDGKRPSMKLAAAIRQDVENRGRPTWKPLQRVLAAWAGLTSDDFRRRVTEVKVWPKRVPFGEWKKVRNLHVIAPPE